MTAQSIARVLATAAVCGIAASSAGADDLIQPPWRGSDGTTYEQWTFDDAANPATPEIMDNPYGSALATIVKMEHSDGWYANVLGRDGVWGDLESMTLDIDNREDPLAYKEIWIQITYYLAPNNEPTVTVPGALYLGGETRQLEPYIPGSWYLQQSKWRIEPNPDHEVIEITTGPMGMTIDQIVVDTICTPEPATMGLFALAGLGLLVRRNRHCSGTG